LETQLPQRLPHIHRRHSHRLLFQHHSSLGLFPLAMLSLVNLLLIHFLWSTPAKENTVPFRQQSGQSPKVNISLRFPLLFRLPLVLFHLSMLKIYLYSNHRLLTEGVEAQRQHLFIFQHSSIQRRHISSGAMDKPPFLR